MRSADRQVFELRSLQFDTFLFTELRRLSMLQPWPYSGAVRLFARSLHRPLLIRPHNLHFSSVASCTLQSAPADRVSLRKQLKQEAKALKNQKKQRRQNEEASRSDWELTVGVEIHAQLDTAAKLFSRMSRSPRIFRSLTDPEQELPLPQPRYPIPMSPCLTSLFRGASRLVYIIVKRNSR